MVFKNNTKIRTYNLLILYQQSFKSSFIRSEIERILFGYEFAKTFYLFKLEEIIIGKKHLEIFYDKWNNPDYFKKYGRHLAGCMNKGLQQNRCNPLKVNGEP